MKTFDFWSSFPNLGSLFQLLNIFQAVVAILDTFPQQNKFESMAVVTYFIRGAMHGGAG